MQITMRCVMGPPQQQHAAAGSQLSRMSFCDRHQCCTISLAGGAEESNISGTCPHFQHRAAPIQLTLSGYRFGTILPAFGPHVDAWEVVGTNAVTVGEFDR